MESLPGSARAQGQGRRSQPSAKVTETGPVGEMSLNAAPVIEEYDTILTDHTGPADSHRGVSPAFGTGYRLEMRVTSRGNGR
ncbi:hypothetical protein NDU88_010632 [Pleurodeles waltl]|uniref:Uncharacterized protein n=1 Tax=Pleurodeles waltl TaxID=8319 RepID=A0AAV7QY21_PLEWA|nr:hypothetical protein NDU88_010632 [Pleurodeles waltl]